MPTEAELKAQRDQLDKTLTEIKTQGGANAAAIHEVAEGLKTMRQTVEVLNRASIDSRMGPVGECAFYIDAVTEREMAQAEDCYAKTSNGTIRLFGHEVKSETGDYYVPGLIDDVDVKDPAQARLQRALSDAQITRRTLRKLKRKDANAPVWTPHADQQVRRALAAMPGQVGKIFADLDSFGADMMPYTKDADFERDLLASHTLANAITQISHPGGTLEVPFVEGVLQAFIDKIPTTDDPPQARNSSLGTDNSTIKCVEMACASQVHRAATEQSIVAMLPLLRQEMARAHSFADDNALVNGQVSGSEFDTIAGWNVRGRMAVTAADAENQLYACLGMRGHARADGTTLDMGAKSNFDGVVELVNLLGIEALLGLDGTNRIVIGVSPEYFFTQMYKWSEFQTFDQVGALNSLVTGFLGDPNAGRVAGLPNQVGYLFGRFPVVLLYTLTADLDDTGVHSATELNNTRTGILAMDLGRYQRWYRNGVMVESEVDIRQNTVTLVSRQGRKLRRSNASQPSAAFGYDLPAAFS